MRSFWATRVRPSAPTRIHPALTSFADECTATFARLLAYVGTLALVAMLSVHLWDQMPTGESTQPREAAGWALADRSHPAFAVSQSEFLEKPAAYDIFRHPLGGRRDVIRWTGPGEKAVAELEIYRPGGESGSSGPAFADIPTRMESNDAREMEAAGVIDSKFGAVTLLRRPGEAGSCHGFHKRLDDPGLQISGWSCQGDAFPVQRAAVDCMLNRLILLTAGNDPKLAELFARAELRRTNCVAASPGAASADWVSSAGNPLLRGSM